VRVAHLTAQGHDVATERRPTRARRLAGTRRRRQREAICCWPRRQDGIDSAELAQRGITPAILKRLSVLGLVTFTRRRVERDPAEHASAASDRPAVVELTAEQRAAFDRLTRLAQSGTFATALLHGVTGAARPSCISAWRVKWRRRARRHPARA
jgi:primosomal protein N'